MKSSQLLQAAILGTQAFKNGDNRIPAQNKELMDMIANRKVGEVPIGEASSSAIMSSWLEAYDNANFYGNWDAENITIGDLCSGIEGVHYLTVCQKGLNGVVKIKITENEWQNVKGDTAKMIALASEFPRRLKAFQNNQ